MRFSDSVAVVKVILFQRAFSRGVPSSKSLWLSIPSLHKRGVHLQVYCWEAQEDVDGVVVTRLPAWSVHPLLDDWIFTVVASVVSGWKRLRRSRHDETVLLSIDQYAVFADISMVHFDHLEWLAWQPFIRCETVREYLGAAVASLMCLGAGLLISWNPWMRRLIAVSEASAEYLRRTGAPWNTVTAIPNILVLQEAPGELQRARREEYRQRMGFTESDRVFCFCSMGHLRRKGFWLAVKALHRLRAGYGHLNVRFLVIGGTPGGVERTRAACARLTRGDDGWITHMGATDDVLGAMSACEAFLFPSYSDTFCFAAYEAAGVGLRTYLTPFHGAQSLLDSYANAREIPWDEERIAGILHDDLGRDLVRTGEGNRAGFSCPESYAESLKAFLFPMA